MSWQVRISPLAEAQLQAIQDMRIRALVAKVITRLTEDPDKQGKPMRDELTGLRSVRAAGQRYRILYQSIVELSVS